MKSFIVGITVVLLSTFFITYQQDSNLHQLKLHELKYVAEEVAAAAAQFHDLEEYGEGRLVFNQEEGIKAAEYVLKQTLSLNDDFKPKSGTYYQDQIKLHIEFLDESNTIFPYTYTDTDTNFTQVITEPSVAVTINAGKARYRVRYIQLDQIDCVRTAIHEWKER